MILNRVTVTGADDSIRPADLIPIAERFPFVEFGILLSRSQEGGVRFPSLKWIEELQGLSESLDPGLRLSGHLCGAWVRDFCRGEPTFWLQRPSIARRFARLQLNFHSLVHDIPERGPFDMALRMYEPKGGRIFQLDAVNNAILDRARGAQVQAVGLFDLSGGAGVLPADWPESSEGYSGYAGGLSPENLQEQLARIDLVTLQNARIWIDAETHLFSNGGRQFDLGRVERFLEIAARWVSR
jgi:hypothetical protein